MRLEPQSRWDNEAINNVIEVPWKMTNDPIPIPPLPSEGARIQRESITKQDIEKFKATVGCQGCNAIRDNKRAQAHSDRCRGRIEGRLRITPQGAERLDRRNEVINEALAEEIRKAKQRKGRDADAAATMPAEPAASAARDLRESPVEPDPNPKRRLSMKSASSAASDSGQQREKRPVTDTESGAQARDPLETGTGENTTSPTALFANTRRRIVMKSKPLAVTTQEAVDGCRAKPMSIASVELVDLGNIMELSITSQVLKWARQMHLSGGLSLCRAVGWNMKNQSHLMVARRLREKIHPNMLVVTIREREERGICSATLGELLRIVKDQV